jgi:hypothetical protein
MTPIPVLVCDDRLASRVETSGGLGRFGLCHYALISWGWGRIRSPCSLLILGDSLGPPCPRVHAIL